MKKITLFIILLFVSSFALLNWARPSQASVPETAVLPQPDTASNPPIHRTDACAFPTSLHTVYLPTLTRDGEAPAPQPMVRELQYEVGKTYIYKYQLSSEALFGVVTKESGVVAETPSVTLAYGYAYISITDQRDDVFTGHIWLEDPTLCQQNPDGADEFMDDPETLADLQTPLVFQQDKYGTIVDVQVAEDVDLGNANFLKGILNSLQGTLQVGDQYAVMENGGQGVYEADYVATLQQQGLHLHKSLTEDSFVDFYSQGDLNGVAIDNQIQMVLGRTYGVFSYVSFNEMTDVFMEDPHALDPDEFDGVAMWGYTRSSGKLELTAVETTNPVAKPVSQTRYVSTGMGAHLGEMAELTYAIDMATVDFDAELDAYIASSTTANYQRLRQLMKVDGRDPSTAVLSNLIADRLLNNLDDETAALRYIDLLGNDGSPYAQSILRRLIDPADPLFSQATPNLQTQVFAMLSLWDDPQPETYNLLSTILDSTTASEEVKQMALLGRGTVASAIADSDETTANAIYDDLVAQLGNATEIEETRLLLLALGNTGHPDLVNVLLNYLPQTDPEVEEPLQIAAIWALRKVPGKQAEDLLLQIVEDEGGIVKPVPQDMGATALKNRPGKPSDNVNDTLAGYYGDPPQPGGAFHWNWTRQIGGDRLGGYLPGSVVIETVPRLNAHASQAVEYYMDIPKFDYYDKDTLASANAWSKPVNDQLQQFGYDFKLFGQDVKSASITVACADDGIVPIRDGYIDLFEAQFEYPVWWILSVGVEFEATAHYDLHAEYDWNVCSPGNLSASVALVGDAGVHAFAFGYAAIPTGLPVVRGGPKLEADIIQLNLRGQLSGTYTADDGFEACLQVPVELKVGNVYFYIYAERFKIIPPGWGVVYSKLIWNHALWTGSFNVVSPFCWP